MTGRITAADAVPWDVIAVDSDPTAIGAKPVKQCGRISFDSAHDSPLAGGRKVARICVMW